MRGTVRSLQDVDYLLHLEGAAERLELVEADLLRDGSFDAAVRGCAHVYHTARCRLSVCSGRPLALGR